METAASAGLESGKLYRALSFCLILLFTFKNVFIACVETAVLGSILSSALCILPEDIARAHLFSNIIFLLGLYNLVQSTFGVRLSVMHSPSFVLLCPLLFYLTSSPESQCPGFGDLVAMGPHRRTAEWRTRLAAVHGCLVLVAAAQALCSVRAVHSFLCRLVPPISLISCVLFIPIALLNTMMERCSQSVVLSMGTLLLFPIIAYNISWKLRLKFYDVKFNVFSVFAIPITVTLVWSICFLLTWFDLLPSLSRARTDYHSTMLDYVDYQYKHLFEWGLPSLSLSAATVVVPVLLITIPLSVESYKAANKIQARSQCNTKLSRGLYFEALAYLLNLVLGGATGFQISLESLQDIAETKIWNKTIVQISGIFLILMSMCSTLCVYVTLMPAPLLGSMLVILCVQQLVGWLRILAAKVDLLSTRNLYIVAMSLLLPVILERALRSYPVHAYLSLLLLVVTTATVLNHVTYGNAHSSESTPIEHPPPRSHNAHAPNEALDECVLSCQQMACGCLSCFV